MPTVNMHEAKSRLSALVEAVESGREVEVVIARNGKPAARLVPIADDGRPRRRGSLAKDRYVLPEGWEREDEEIRRLFEDGPIFPDE